MKARRIPRRPDIHGEAFEECALPADAFDMSAPDDDELAAIGEIVLKSGVTDPKMDDWIRMAVCEGVIKLTLN